MPGDDQRATAAPIAAMKTKALTPVKSRLVGGHADAAAASTPTKPNTTITARPAAAPQICRNRRMTLGQGVTVTFTSAVVQQHTSPPPPSPE